MKERDIEKHKADVEYNREIAKQVKKVKI